MSKKSRRRNKAILGFGAALLGASKLGMLGGKSTASNVVGKTPEFRKSFVKPKKVEYITKKTKKIPGIKVDKDVISSGPFKMFGATNKGLKEEIKNIDCDKKYYDVRRSKVLNKNARHNVCFDYRDQEPDIANKKGRIVNINSLKNLKSVISNLYLYFGDKAKGLIAELNHYYDVKKCGIGFHGDTERRIVICVRLGESFPLHYYWYENSKRVGQRITLPHLNEGDIYIMSDKAVGYDWKLRRNNRLTLRHSAGCAKFTK